MSPSSNPRDRFPVLGKISRRLDRWFSPAGKALAMASLLFLAGASHLDTPLYQLFGAGISLLLTSALLSRLFRPRLEFRWRLPAVCFAQEPIRLALTMSNTMDRPQRNLRLRIRDSRWQPVVPPSFDLAPGETRILPVTVVPPRRGRSPTPITEIQSCFPLNLTCSNTPVGSTRDWLVAPRRIKIHDFKILKERLGRLDGAGFSMASTGSDERTGAREYTPGFPVRRWAYSAWARTGRPHVFEFERESRPRIELALDLDASDQRSFEATLSLAVSIVEWMTVRELDLDSFLIGDNAVSLTSVEPAARWQLIATRLATWTESTAILGGSSCQGRPKIVRIVLSNRGETREPERRVPLEWAAIRITVGDGPNRNQTAGLSNPDITVEQIEAGEVHL